MILYPPGPHRPGDDSSLLRTVWAALPRTYAIVFYSTDVRFGWCLLAMSLLVPGVGIAGLLGVALAASLAWAMNVDRGWIRSGFVLFNPLLACSSIALASRLNGWAPLPTLILWAGALALSLVMTISIQGWISSKIGISAQSLPAAIAVILLGWCGFVSTGGHAPETLSGAMVGDWLGLPGYLGGFFKAFAAMVFHDSDIAGVLVYVFFVMASPLGAMMATAGYVAGATIFAILGLPVDPAGIGWCGFNFLLAGVALGAGYQVPNRSSFVLAMVGSAAVALVALGLSLPSGWLKLSPGALPYNIVVVSTIAALRLLVRPAGLIPSPWIVLQPEGVARITQIADLRYPDWHKPAIFLPVPGANVITQSFDGPITHRGAWKHALDFETAGVFGSWDPRGALPEDYAIFGQRVYCPTKGTVVGVENRVPDNPIGGNNPEKNWGNYVIVRSERGFHVMLAHFRQGSVEVSVGQQVGEGDFLGLVGNSGRSPLPHLHVHVQGGPVAGAPTIPFVLKHYVCADPANGRETYRSSGVPAAHSLVRPASPSEGLFQCLAGWLPGNYKYRWGSETVELCVDFDEMGRFRLSTLSPRESITTSLAEGVLHSSTYGGSAGGLIALLGLTLAKVPCIEDPEVEWTDLVASVPFLRGWRKWLHDLADPFSKVAVLVYKFRLAFDGEGYVVTAELQAPPNRRPPHAPAVAKAKICGRIGVSVLWGFLANGEEFRYEQERPKV